MDEEKLRRIIQSMIDNNEPPEKIKEAVSRGKAMMSQSVKTEDVEIEEVEEEVAEVAGGEGQMRDKAVGFDPTQANYGDPYSRFVGKEIVTASTIKEKEDEENDFILQLSKAKRYLALWQGSIITILVTIFFITFAIGFIIDNSIIYKIGNIMWQRQLELYKLNLLLAKSLQKKKV